MSDALNLEPGALVGGYTLVSRLGSGAMGSVWRVRDDGGQEYAMKILRDSLRDERPGDAQAERDQLTARERLRREAMSLRKVDHPGVCGIVDMELDDSLAFIVTELIEGRNLREDVAANGPYVADDLERLAARLMDAVRAVHAAGIVHRDIKPTNVMISATGPVLVDFGIAMGAGESHVTRTGLVMGTPGFIAPEIIEGTESDDITDWWSVASVLAFAATGKPVFGTKPMMAVLEREAAGNANLSGLPAGTMAAFRSALNPDRNRRCTPEQLLQAITMDAFDPSAWQQAQGGGVLGTSSAPAAQQDGSEADGQDVMRPFDESGLSNPRLLWRPVTQADAFVPASSGNTETEPIESGMPPTSVMPDSAQTGSTPTLPLNGIAGAAPDRVMTSHAEAGNMEANPADAVPTVADPTLRPALQRLIQQQPHGFAVPHRDSSSPDGTSDDRTLGVGTQVMPSMTQPMPSEWPETAQETQALPPTRPPQPRTAQSSPIQPTQEPTFETRPITPYPPALDMPQPYRQQTPQQAPYAPPYPAPPQPAVNPTLLKREAMIRRGTPLTVACMAPVAAVAAAAPLAGMMLSCALCWLLLTLGYCADARLKREYRRGGKSGASDMALSVVTMPWHLLRGLLQAVPRALLATAVLTLGVTLFTLILGLPTINLRFPLFGIDIVLPVVATAVLSPAGLAVAASAAAGWAAGMIAPAPTIMRLGAGAAMGSGTSVSELGGHVNPTIDNAMVGAAMGSGVGGTGRSGREIVIWIIWAIITLSACVAIALSSGIDWWPLPYSIA